MNSRTYRVVVYQNGEIVKHYGYMHDKSTALRIRERFQAEGAVVQHQRPQTVITYPWETLPTAFSRKQESPDA